MKNQNIFDRHKLFYSLARDTMKIRHEKALLWTSIGNKDTVSDKG